MTAPLRETAERLDHLHRQVLAVAEVWVLAADRPQRDMHIVDKARITFMAALATALRTARDEALEEAVQAATSAPASATTYNARLTIAKRIRALASKDEQR